ncbi:MAG: hypothetical protein GY737_10220 [Desulfobacteraceae bacterium]|nr:hypothetical protein [Desulfobacteraceae bacterium]
MYQPTSKYQEFKAAGHEALGETMVKIKMAIDKLEGVPTERVIMVVDTPLLVEFVNYVQVGGQVFLRPTTFLHHELSGEEQQNVLNSFYEYGAAVIIATPSVLKMLQGGSFDRALCMLQCSKEEIHRILKPPYKVTFLLRGNEFTQ